MTTPISHRSPGAADAMLRVRRIERVQLLTISFLALALVAGGIVAGVRGRQAANAATNARAAVDLAAEVNARARSIGTGLLSRGREAASGQAPIDATKLLDTRRLVVSAPGLEVERRNEITMRLDRLLSEASVATAGRSQIEAARRAADLEQSAEAWLTAARATLAARIRVVDTRSKRMIAGGLVGATILLLAVGVLTPLVVRRRRRLAVELDGGRAHLERLSRTDSLTGLANHGTFHESLERHVAEVSLSGRSLSLAILDVDHFKRINDAYGHLRGDAVLAFLAQRLRALAPEGHVVARVGGEEFAWLMPGLDATAATQLAEQSRAAIAARPIDESGVSVTVSCGVAEWAPGGSSHDLLRAADQALYAAKTAGRDAVSTVSGIAASQANAVDAPNVSDRLRSLAFLRSLAHSVDAKSPATRRHSQRVADLAARLAEELGWDATSVAKLHQAAMVHDVGKLAVPDAVLLATDPLDEGDWEAVRRHPELGAEMLANVLADCQVAWVRHHHERWDGRGYPSGLAGEEIPAGARLIAIAEAWDAMTAARVHATPLPYAQALAEVERGAGHQFCPGGAATLIRLVRDGSLTGLIAAERPRNVRRFSEAGSVA